MYMLTFDLHINKIHVLLQCKSPVQFGLGSSNLFKGPFSEVTFHTKISD